MGLKIQRRQKKGGEETRKMKNLALVLAGLIFAFGILTASIWKTQALTSSQNFKIQTLPEVVGAKVTPTPSPTPTVDYFLPYPGILPDNKILYPIKMIRDRILLFLTFDPVQKGERLLFFADKRINAAKALIEGGKTELGISTLTKGEKYLEQAIAQAEKAKKAGKETTGLYEKLAQATLKHQEVLTGFLVKVPDETKAVIEDVLQYSRQGYETVSRVIEKK